ncbi:superoxide dismutase family protein [Singulisphaera sp. PoT]|uniref:superoxide dismutase family protein n=1 Tax=Singulisphaera sp. PoT TaxID=3411797 RepID=UPI003BF4CD9C
MNRKSIVTTLTTAGLTAAVAIGSWAQAPAPHAPSAAAPSGPAVITKAVAFLHATKKDPKGGEAGGKVVFTKVAEGVRVEAHLHGLTPGLHGFHVHEFGDTGSDDGMATGGHFNPLGAPHGEPHATKRHVGDLGNIEADEKGHAKLDVVDPSLSFDGPTSIIGRGLVVHGKADDLKSQPAGAAGDRVAVGTIGVAKPAAPAAK